MDRISAIEQLTSRYQEPLNAADPADERPVAGVTSNTVPWELLVASGFRPTLLRSSRRPTPLADVYMEDVFDLGIRSLLDHCLSGEYGWVDTLVIPRTSEQEHKLFLYLAEIKRQEPGRHLPRVLFYNLLHAQSLEAAAYGLKRTQELGAELRYDPELLRKAIEDGNVAREAFRQVLELRYEQKISGHDAFSMLGAFWFMDRREFARLAAEACEELKVRDALPGPRVLIKGSSLDHAHLHRLIESFGVVVVAEDDWRGSRGGGGDIATDGDLMVRIFEKYYLDSPSPRTYPPEISERWFFEHLSRVDGVVFYLSPEDDVMGWDYPRLRDELKRRGVPHTLIRTDALEGGMSVEEQEDMNRFVGELGK